MSEKRRISVIPNRFKLLNSEGTAGVLLGYCCSHCGEHLFGETSFCQNCSSRDLESVELSKEGTLYSYTIVHVPPAGWQGTVPYILGQVELPEGPHVLSEVINCSPEQLIVGMDLELALVVGGEDSEGNEVVVYKWEPPSSPE